MTADHAADFLRHAESTVRLARASWRRTTSGPSREPWVRLGPAGVRVRAVFTSLAETDRTRIDRLVGVEAVPSGPGSLSR